MRQPSAADMNSLTDMRVGIVKAALQLTPDQEKYWPAVEEALRTRAKNQQARLERLAELHANGAVDALHDRNPIEHMQSRADRLIQRGTDLETRRCLGATLQNVERGSEEKDGLRIRSRHARDARYDRTS